MRRTKIIIVAIFFILVFNFSTSALTQYTSEDYEEAKDCLNNYLIGVLTLDFEKALSCKLPGYEQRCRLVITNKNSTGIQYSYDSDVNALQEKYGEVHSGYVGQPLSYSIVAAEPYTAIEIALENGYLDGIKIKVLINSYSYIAHLAKDNNNLWKIYQIAPGSNFQGSNAYVYSQPQNKPDPYTNIPWTNTPYSPYQHLSEALIGGLIGAIIANLKRYKGYYDVLSAIKEGTKHLKNPKWRYVKILLRPMAFIATVINLYDAITYCAEKPMLSKLARGVWLVAEIFIPVILPFLIVGSLPLASATIVGSIILSYITAIFLGKVTTLLFPSS